MGTLKTMAKRKRLRRILMTRDELRVDFVMFSIVCVLLFLALSYIVLFSSHDFFTRLVFVISGIPIIIYLWISRYIRVKKVLKVPGPRWQKPPTTKKEDE